MPSKNLSFLEWLPAKPATIPEKWRSWGGMASQTPPPGNSCKWKVQRRMTMNNIGIIGAGIAGLHLGLLLRNHGIKATIYTEKGPEQQRAARLGNIVVRNAPTRERERMLGVNHWDSSAP